MSKMIPTIAGFVAGIGITVFTGGAGAFGMSALMTATLAGAAVGGVVGGIQTAIEGGSIFEGVLWGAVGGTVGGALGGAVSVGFVSEMTMGAYFKGGVVGAEGTVHPSVAARTAAQAPPPGVLAPGGSVAPPAAGGIGTAEKLIMAQGGLGLLQGGMSGDSGEVTEKDRLTAELEREKIAAQKEIAAISRGGGADALGVARIQQETAMKELAQREKEFEASIKQRKEEMLSPIREAAAARARQRETLVGLKVKPKRVSEEEGALLPG